MFKHCYSFIAATDKVCRGSKHNVCPNVISDAFAAAFYCPFTARYLDYSQTSRLLFFFFFIITAGVKANSMCAFHEHNFLSILLCHVCADRHYKATYKFRCCPPFWAASKSAGFLIFLSSSGRESSHGEETGGRKGGCFGVENKIKILLCVGGISEKL